MPAGDDYTLIKIAVVGITISLMASIMITVLISGNGDYDFDEITGYRDDLVEFSGESMINQTPWVLTGVYTPWISGLPIEGHTDPDGYLFGESVDYAEIGKSANIKLDPTQKSAVPITPGDDRYTYETVTGVKWWADTGPFTPLTFALGYRVFGQDPYVYEEATAYTWAYTGYRYTFDPTLPFSQESEKEVSSVDGTLSLVWYSYNSQEGLSGAIQIYGGDVLISTINATDIINSYKSTNGLATTYDFVFDGVNLTLSIRFNQNVLDEGVPLMQAWTSGDWTMAVSSTSAGNFLDIENSASFTNTAGSIVKTFSDVFTFSLPSINNWWMDLILWLLVGLPFSIAMICGTLRIISAIKIW